MFAQMLMPEFQHTNQQFILHRNKHTPYVLCRFCAMLDANLVSVLMLMKVWEMYI